VAQVAAPFELSDALRERLMTVHAATAILMFGLCLVHVGAVLFNRIVRRVSVIDRMLAPILRIDWSTAFRLLRSYLLLSDS